MLAVGGLLTLLRSGTVAPFVVSGVSIKDQPGLHSSVSALRQR